MYNKRSLLLYEETNFVHVMFSMPLLLYITPIYPDWWFGGFLLLQLHNVLCDHMGQTEGPGKHSPKTSCNNRHLNTESFIHWCLVEFLSTSLTSFYSVQIITLGYHFPPYNIV